MTSLTPPVPPFQSKNTLHKFCDSLLTKKNKINSLIRDLDQNYGCDKAVKSRESLEEHLAEIDKQHETLNELRTNGDVYGWNDQLMKDAEGKMKAATLKCSGQH
ncbi:unnamed protein product [Symbiodinium sp. CCMP2592]|nr:unnamed protein product [Symbiodinium sp. CCMP2592]